MKSCSHSRSESDIRAIGEGSGTDLTSQNFFTDETRLASSVYALDSDKTCCRVTSLDLSTCTFDEHVKNHPREVLWPTGVPER